uniref:Sulfotransferase n=1 Tax=Uncultured archaeon GZfos26G2 TaxID=3386331 RepID=Q64C27_UNCAG|nr:sulfotransferase [uncultured archaeon GZfos26D6]
MKMIVLSVVVGMMLLTVTVGTVAGDESLMCAMGCNCPHSGPATDYLKSPFNDDYSSPSFLMGADAERKSHSKSVRSDRSHTIFETTIPIRPTNSQYENPSLITYIDELKNINDPKVVIVDVCSPAKYAAGHIPGAINLPWELFRADNGVLTSLENVTGLLGEHGISPDNGVIVYSDTCQTCGGLSASSYIFWMLEYIGHEKVSVLDGGFDAWNATYGCTKNVTTRSPTTYYSANVMEDRFADTERVLNNLNHTTVQIVDARTTEDYKADKIEGAINIEYEELFRDGYRLKGADDLEFLISPVVIKRLDKSKDTVVYCWSGASSSFLYFALRLMGYQVRNYDESWNVWCETKDVLTIPITNVSVEPSFAYKGSTVKIYAEVELRSEMKKESKGSLIIHGNGKDPYNPGSFCAGCSGVYAVPLPTTDVSFVRAYIHKEDNVGTTVVMHDYNGDGRYEGEWQTYATEDGTYYIDIEATDGELTRKKGNAATVEVAIEAAGP